MVTWPNSPRNQRTGPGSRGGRWHDPEYRRAYQRKWRLSHPEYVERERLRRHRARHGADPSGARLTSVPSAVPCGCMDCSCEAVVTVVLCGLCRAGLHGP